MVVWFVNAEFAPKKKIESFARKNVIATARTNITTVPGDKSHEKIVEGVLSWSWIPNELKSKVELYSYAI